MVSANTGGATWGAIAERDRGALLLAGSCDRQHLERYMSSFMRFARAAVSVAAFACAVGSVGCASHAANSRPATNSDAAPVPDDEATAGLLEHHRYHHHGGVTLFVAMSLDTLGLPPNTWRPCWQCARRASSARAKRSWKTRAAQSSKARPRTYLPYFPAL